MATTGIKHEIIELEKEFWRAMQVRDTSTAARLTDEKCVVVGQESHRQRGGIYRVVVLTAR